MIMSLEQLNTLDAIKQFLDGTQSVAFKAATDKQERYRWVQGTLVKHHYFRLGKTDKGTVTRYLMKVTGYSHAQTKRLIRQYVKSGAITTKPARRNGFKRAYSETDIRLLASMDERHGQPSGAVLKKLCERALALRPARVSTVSGYLCISLVQPAILQNLSETALHTDKDPPQSCSYRPAS